MANHIYKQHNAHSITIATALLDWQLLLIYSYHLMPITISTMATQWSPCNVHSSPTSTLLSSLHPSSHQHSIPPLTNTPSLPSPTLLSSTLHPSSHQQGRDTLLTLMYGLASKARSSASSSVLQGANAFSYGGDRRERDGTSKFIHIRLPKID